MRHILVAALMLAACSESPMNNDDEENPPAPSLNCTALAMPVPGAATGSIATSDCKFENNSYFDLFSILLTSPAMLNINITGASALEPAWEVYNAANRRIAHSQDDIAANQRARVLVPNGTFRVAAKGAPNQTGSYTLSVAGSTAALLTNCVDVWVPKDVVIDETLTTSSCGPAANPWWDNYVVALKSGESLTVNLTTSEFRSVLRLYNFATGALINQVTAPTTSSNTNLTYTATTDVAVLIQTSVVAPNTGGNYRISIR